MTINLNRLNSILLFFMVCFPYISLIDTPFDTQPYAVAFSTLILILMLVYQKDVKIHKLLIPYLIVLAYALIMYLLNPNATGLRSLVGYASVCILAIAGFTCFKSVKTKHFISVVIVWFVFGVSQLLISKRLGAFLLPRLSTSEERGITSLAVEPSLYSVICIYFLILNDIFLARKSYSKKIHFSVSVLIIIQLLLSRTGVGFVLFFIYLISKMISQRNVVRIFQSFIGILSLFIIIVLLLLNVPDLKMTRLGSLVYLLFNNPSMLIFSDGSIIDRIVHIVVSHLSIFYSYGLGLGLGNWSIFAHSLVDHIGGFTSEIASIYMTTGSGRIMSGWGTAIFELGLIGVLFLGAFIYLMRLGYRRTSGEIKKVYLSSFITLYFLMLMAVPLSFPLFGYMIGVFVYLQSKQIESH
jgi:hypothetical protein